MAICSRQEFADMCGIDVKRLNVDIGRNKVIVSGEKGKKIDSEELLNLQYKKKCKEANKAKIEAKVLNETIFPNPRRGKNSDDDESDDDVPDSDKHFNSNMIAALMKGGGGGENPYIIKVKKDTELVEIKIQKEQLLLDKTAGKLIPVDVVANILRGQAKSIFTNIENAMENMASIYCTIMANGDMTMYTRILEDGQKHLALAIERAGADATKDLDNSLNEYAQTKSTRF